MISTWTGPTALLLISLAQASWTPATAQTGPSDSSPADEPAPRDSTVDVSRLPINLARIQRQLRQSTVREERDGLNLRYVVDVFGEAPRLQLFTKQDNLLTGASRAVRRRIRTCCRS